MDSRITVTINRNLSRKWKLQNDLELKMWSSNHIFTQTEHIVCYSYTEIMYTLTYFNIRGIVETIRIMFAIAKVEYEDVRYPLVFTPSGGVCEEFKADREKGLFEIALNKVPIFSYEDGDEKVIFSQSKAIERFVAKV